VSNQVNGAIPQSADEEAEPPESGNISRPNNSIITENDAFNSIDPPSGVEIISKPTFEATYQGPQFNCPAFSYVNPKIRCTRSPNGCGLFAIRKINQDELLLGWAGKVVHVSEIKEMNESERTYILQIDEELFQVPFWKGYNEPADFVNHSCNPNAGFGHSGIVLVAMRDIEPGEEITFDYAMCECVEGLKGNEFECCCTTPHCRGAFTGSDWKSPKLWARYGNYFSPYLRKKIKALKKQRQNVEIQNISIGSVSSNE